MIAYELGAVPRVFIGPGAVVRLPEIVGGLEGASALLVVDQAVAATGWSTRVAAMLEGIPVVEHLVPAGEPTVASVDAAAEAARRLDGAVVVGIGGGSALDTAKQAAVACAAAESVSHYLLGANAFAERRPIVAVPTTSGTGAEVTRTCVLSDGQGRKMWTWGDEMLPDAVVLDPTATASMPAYVTASTGLDALVLDHLPVAVGLDAALAWNVQNAPDGFEVVGAALGRPAAELPEVLTDLFSATSFERAVRHGPDVAFDARAIAATMAAPENEPMLRDNCVVPDVAARCEHAARTVDRGRVLRGAS